MPYPKIKCGCLGCGQTFKAEKDGHRALERAIQHMEKCCPAKLEDYHAGHHMYNQKGQRVNLLQRCWIGCKNCEVPGYVHETRNQRKRRDSANAKVPGETIMEFFAKRDQIAERCGMKSSVETFPMFPWDLFGGSAMAASGAASSAYHDFDDGDDDDDYDHTQVEFLRPDGDIEGKDVQWCLDNNFFQIEDGFWSGPWFYTDHPEERPMHQKRLLETQLIRKRNTERQSRVRAKWGQEEDAEKGLEEEFCAMLKDDIARTLYGRVNNPPPHDSEDAALHTATTAEGLGSQFSSLKLNPNATDFKPARSSLADAPSRKNT